MKITAALSIAVSMAVSLVMGRYRYIPACVATTILVTGNSNVSIPLDVACSYTFSRFDVCIRTDESTQKTVS